MLSPIQRAGRALERTTVVATAECAADVVTAGLRGG
jgi:hypothetical protein